VDNKKPKTHKKLLFWERKIIFLQMYAIRLFEHTTNLLHELFLQTDFGKLYQTIPFKELDVLIPAPSGSVNGRGCKARL
jgi:hypothetical protein